MANPANPQSWNRYAYVMNDPLRGFDPTGLAMIMGCKEAYKPPCIFSDAGGGLLALLAADANDNFGDTFGCDSISDAIDPSGNCAQAMNWFVDPNWSPFSTEATSDPCVYMNDSATGVDPNGVDNNSNPTECKNHGGTWVPQGSSWYVDPKAGQVVIISPSPTTLWNDVYEGAVIGAFVGGATGCLLGALPGTVIGSVLGGPEAGGVAGGMGGCVAFGVSGMLNGAVTGAVGGVIAWGVHH